MASTIQLKTGTGSAVPSSLTQGEVGINIDNGLIYYGSGSGNDVKQLETFTTVTGLTVQEFQSLARENPAQVLNIFVQELARISKEGGNTVAILDDLGLKQQRTIRALLAVGEVATVTVGCE